MISKAEILKTELEKIRKSCGGILKPEAIVDAAREKSSPLHCYFEWDDTAAAKAHRLWQARMLIVTVTVEFPAERNEIITLQRYISLKSDQRNGGGYRAIVEVLQNDKRRQEFIEDLRSDIRIFTQKYRMIREAREIILVMHKTDKKLRVKSA